MIAYIYKPIFPIRKNKEIVKSLNEAIVVSSKTHRTVYMEADSLSELTDPDLVDKIVDFIKKNPFPKDHADWHEFADSLGIEPEIIEQYAYAMLTVILTGGKSKGDTSKITDEQYAIGKEIEKEHVDLDIDNPVVKKMQEVLAKKISCDHFAEDSGYYTGTVNFKDELKKERKIK